VATAAPSTPATAAAPATLTGDLLVGYDDLVAQLVEIIDSMCANTGVDSESKLELFARTRLRPARSS
jgi:hypothetical protein